MKIKRCHRRSWRVSLCLLALSGGTTTLGAEAKAQSQAATPQFPIAVTRQVDGQTWVKVVLQRQRFSCYGEDEWSRRLVIVKIDDPNYEYAKTKLSVTYCLDQIESMEGFADFAQLSQWASEGRLVSADGTYTKDYFRKIPAFKVAQVIQATGASKDESYKNQEAIIARLTSKPSPVTPVTSRPGASRLPNTNTASTTQASDGAAATSVTSKIQSAVMSSVTRVPRISLGLKLGVTKISGNSLSINSFVATEEKEITVRGATCARTKAGALQCSYEIRMIFGGTAMSMRISPVDTGWLKRKDTFTESSSGLQSSGLDSYLADVLSPSGSGSNSGDGCGMYRTYYDLSSTSPQYNYECRTGGTPDR